MTTVWTVVEGVALVLMAVGFAVALVFAGLGLVVLVGDVNHWLTTRRYRTPTGTALESLERMRRRG